MPDTAGIDFSRMEEDGKVYNIKHRAFYFSRNIIDFISSTNFDRIFFSVFDQLLRSATSIGANLVEGIAGSSKNDFLKFNIISLKSANETKYWLCLIRDTIPSIDRKRIESLLAEVNEISKIIATIIINCKKEP